MFQIGNWLDIQLCHVTLVQKNIFFALFLFFICLFVFGFSENQILNAFLQLIKNRDLHELKKYCCFRSFVFFSFFFNLVCMRLNNSRPTRFPIDIRGIITSHTYLYRIFNADLWTLLSNVVIAWDEKSENSRLCFRLMNH